MFPSSTKAVYIAKPDYISELCTELGSVSQVIENLVFSDVVKTDVCFALDVWINPDIVHFQSISEAARILRQAGKYWYFHPIVNVRRATLIASELRKLPDLRHAFPIMTPLPTIGCFTLLDQNTLLLANQRWKAPTMGNFQFIEDKINPPNRAYLKLWEALSLLEQLPRSGDKAVDLGASPGGWTYVMQGLGASVTAIDKAPLTDNIVSLPGVTYQQQSAFAFKPSSIDHPIDWLLSDVACYPERLYPFVMEWIQSNKAKQLIFTLKLQGETDLDIIKQFQSIPNARVIHLYHNKHEATFFYPAPKTLFITFTEGNIT